MAVSARICRQQPNTIFMADDFSQHSENIPQPAGVLEGAQAQIKQVASDFSAAAAAKVDELRAAAAPKIEEFRAAANAKADEFRSAATAKAEEYRGKAEAAYEDAKGRAQNYHEEGEAYVRQNPTQAILGAVAAGFILGLILRK